MLSCFGYKESQKLPAGWNFKGRFRICLDGMRSKSCHKNGASRQARF